MTTPTGRYRIRYVHPYWSLSNRYCPHLLPLLVVIESSMYTPTGRYRTSIYTPYGRYRERKQSH
jgi:hypothetical protein